MRGPLSKKNIHLNDKTFSLLEKIKFIELIFAKFFSFFPFGNVLMGVGEIVGLYAAKEIKSGNSSQLYSLRNVKPLQVKEHIVLPEVC